MSLHEFAFRNAEMKNGTYRKELSMRIEASKVLRSTKSVFERTDKSSLDAACEALVAAINFLK